LIFFLFLSTCWEDLQGVSFLFVFLFRLWPLIGFSHIDPWAPKKNFFIFPSGEPTRSLFLATLFFLFLGFFFVFVCLCFLFFFFLFIKKQNEKTKQPCKERKNWNKNKRCVDKHGNSSTSHSPPSPTLPYFFLSLLGLTRSQIEKKKEQQTVFRTIFPFLLFFDLCVCAELGWKRVLIVLW